MAHVSWARDRDPRRRPHRRPAPAADARSLGLGAALLARLVEIERSHDCTHLAWTAAAANLRGIAFYEREGAVIVSRDEKQVTFRLSL